MKNWQSSAFYLFLILIVSTSCQQNRPESSSSADASPERAAAPADTATIQNVSPAAAYQLIQADSDVVVIDVRTPAEWDGPLGHIPNARLMPIQQIEEWAREIGEWKDKKIVLVCRSGARSSRAANYLKAQGFHKLINVQGGMTAWNQASLPVEKKQ